MPAGAPSKYKPEYADEAMKLCLLGAKDKELADFFNVSESTLNKWKIDYPEFSESLREGKENADAKIAHSLYQQALQGNTTAQIFWLKNRRRQDWRDKQEHELSGPGGEPIQTITRTIVDPAQGK